MKYCNDCKEFFREPVEVSEIHSEVTERDREYHYRCPICGSSDYEDTHKCELCVRQIRSNEDYCQEHKDLIIDLMADVLERLYQYSFSNRKDNVDLIEWWIREETKNDKGV